MRAPSGLPWLSLLCAIALHFCADAQLQATCQGQSTCLKFYADLITPTVNCDQWRVCMDLSGCAPFGTTCVKNNDLFDANYCALPDFRTSSTKTNKQIDATVPQCQTAASGTNVYFLLKAGNDQTPENVVKDWVTSLDYAIPLGGVCQNRNKWDSDLSNTCTSVQTASTERVWTVKAPGTATTVGTAKSDLGQCSSLDVLGLLDASLVLLHPNDWVAVGYAFQVSPTTHPEVTVLVSGSVEFTVTCATANAKRTVAKITIPLPSGTQYTVRANDAPWLPAAGINDLHSWMASQQASVCGKTTNMELTTKPVFKLQFCWVPAGAITGLKVQVHWRAPHATPPSLPNVDCSNAAVEDRYNNTICGATWTAAAPTPTASAPQPISYTKYTTTYALPTDCIVSAWMAWSSPCPCPEGVTEVNRTRTVQNIGAQGLLCGSTTSETKPCTTVCAPVNCDMSPWSSWSTCTACVSTRTRSILAPAINNGQCYSTIDTKSCTKNCPKDVEVIAADSAPTPTTTEGSNSALWALLALVLIPVGLLGYFYYRRTAHSQWRGESLEGPEKVHRPSVISTPRHSLAGPVDPAMPHAYNGTDEPHPDGGAPRDHNPLERLQPPAGPGVTPAMQSVVPERASARGGNVAFSNPLFPAPKAGNTHVV